MSRRPQTFPSQKDVKTYSVHPHLWTMAGMHAYTHIHTHGQIYTRVYNCTQPARHIHRNPENSSQKSPPLQCSGFEPLSLTTRLSMDRLQVPPGSQTPGWRAATRASEKSHLKNAAGALTVWLSGLGVAIQTERFDSRSGTGLGCGPGPQLGAYERQVVDVSLPLCLPSPLSKNKHIKSLKKRIYNETSSGDRDPALIEANWWLLPGWRLPGPLGGAGRVWSGWRWPSRLRRQWLQQQLPGGHSQGTSLFLVLTRCGWPFCHLPLNSDTASVGMSLLGIRAGADSPGMAGDRETFS
ncbi:hypothetical protein HJG60_011141 [Phyllostomus discolor]|uniref:Uncharacterized protein n=1 Tax=Phyllostomus discolor TaxID=89673 RepID=A0A834E7H0_9CHIR|nr:hypothetical protein HJG60_011141 [Phyllostomus discolor]